MSLKINIVLDLLQRDILNHGELSQRLMYMIVKVPQESLITQESIRKFPQFGCPSLECGKLHRSMITKARKDFARKNLGGPGMSWRVPNVLIVIVRAKKVLKGLGRS